MCNETHIFSPGVANDFHFTWNRIFPRRVPTGYGKVGQADFGITGMPNASEKLGIPTFDIQNYSRLGSTRDTLFFELQQTFAVSNITNLVRGRHAIKFGGEIRRYARARIFPTRRCPRKTGSPLRGVREMTYDPETGTVHYRTKKKKGPDVTETLGTAGPVAVRSPSFVQTGDGFSVYDIEKERLISSPNQTIHGGLYE